MRRKSERNKTERSPKKTRAKQVALTEPENAKDSPTSSKQPQKERSMQTRLQSKELEAMMKGQNEKVSSSETDVKTTAAPEDEEDNNGSIWKVTRDDSSSSTEIQKITLSRQRKSSETSSDKSLSRKKSNKWQESGDGAVEEADSADEPLSSCTRIFSSSEQPNDPSSSCPGQDSNEEVSDSKEILPETTSANLSDDKPNIDRQGESNEAICSNQNLDSEPSKPCSPVQQAPSSNGEYTPEEIVAATPKEEKSLEIGHEKSEESSTKEPSDENAPKDTSSDEDDDDKRKDRQVDSTSESNDDVQEADSRSSGRVSRASRRKHRNKYRDSSNSDTQDSEDERPVKTETESYQPEEEESTDISPDIPHEQKERSASPETRTTSLASNTKMEIEPTDHTKQATDNANEKSEQTGSTSAPVAICKPVKVNLKRSFTGRKLVERNDEKTEDTDANMNNESNNMNKENCNNTEEEPKCIPRKRRWGTSLSTDTTPSFSISTDSLKVLVPGAKPLSINEVRLTKDDDEDRDRYRGSDKWPTSNENTNDNKSNDESNAQKNGAAKKGDCKIDNHIAARRKISIVKQSPHMKSPSPPASKPTNILLIKNLVRPFTLNQIKELLSRTGTIVENGFWMDRIKSKCYVEYAHEDQAFETRQALHGISWPVSNPKRLHVEYASKDDMELARELSKDQPPQRKTEPLLASSDTWQQDWGRDDRTNPAKVTVVREWDLGKEDGQQHIKEKEREKKEDKKRRQRSRSPAMEAHLPAPARKFKKKEDEPPPAKLLDDLFRKTKATPCIYWLPLTNEQIVVKEEMRRQHMAEHARRLEEMRRVERNRDGWCRRSSRK